MGNSEKPSPISNITCSSVNEIYTGAPLVREAADARGLFLTRKSQEKRAQRSLLTNHKQLRLKI